MESSLPPKSERPVSVRKPLRQLSLGRGQDLSPASPLISTRNLVPGVSESVVKLDKLGKGATSNVFRAVHAATLKMVALKEVSVSTDADRRAVRTEMRALRTQRSPLLNSTFTTELASCPRIVDYYGSIVRENGNACIAVEYVAGGSLGSWLDIGLRCPEAWIAHIAHQALEALDFVHLGGRVHRDVKPANLLITRNGDLKLADFGAAGVENSARMVGTQRFMAPERLKGGRATAQSDLWSLGLSLATAVLGDSFVMQGSNEFEQLDLAGRARRTLAKATTLSAELTDFLHQCLSRDPARRPALRVLMGHPFLNQRREWTAKCPEVARGIRDRKRRQREEASALSTDAVLNALCQARAEDNLGGSRVDPATAADLAYELGVTAKSLVRNVHRRTQELILELKGGDVSDSGGESVGVGERAGRRDGSVDTGDGGTRQGGRKASGGGIVGGGSDRGHVCHRSAHDATDRGGVDNVDLYMDSDGYLSPPGTPVPELAGWEATQEMAPMATVNSGGGGSVPVVTPRNRLASVDVDGTAGFGRARASSNVSRQGSRRSLEISSSVKLAPKKRAGERGCSQTRRNGPCCEVAGARRGRGRREREREKTTSASSRDRSCEEEAKQAGGSSSSSDCCSRRTGDSRRSLAHRRVEEKPRTAVSRTLPSRSHVSQRSMRGVFQLADQMKAEVTVRDRLHRLRVYPDCFSGREAVQWMLEGGHACSVMEAEKLGNEMMKASVFQHILNSHVFEDSSVFYQFTDGQTPPRPASGGRRLRHIARVVRGNITRKLVYNGGAAGSGDNFEANLEGILKEAANNEGASKSCACPGEKVSKSGRVVVSSSARTNPPSSRSSREIIKTTASSSTRPPVSKGGRKNAPPRLPVSSSIDRSKHRRRGRSGQAQSQLRRISSSMSTATVPETPC